VLGQALQRAFCSLYEDENCRELFVGCMRTSIVDSLVLYIVIVHKSNKITLKKLLLDYKMYTF
jgi:hypothetical protein